MILMIALALMAAHPEGHPGRIEGEPPTPTNMSPLKGMTDRDVEVVEKVCVAAQSEYQNGNKEWITAFLKKAHVDDTTHMMILQLCTFYAKGQIRGMAI